MTIVVLLVRLVHRRPRLLHPGGSALHHHPRIQADDAGGLRARALRALEQDRVPRRARARQRRLLRHQGDGAGRHRRHRHRPSSASSPAPCKARQPSLAAGDVAGARVARALRPRHLRPRHRHRPRLRRAAARRRRRHRHGRRAGRRHGCWPERRPSALRVSRARGGLAAIRAGTALGTGASTAYRPRRRRPRARRHRRCRRRACRRRARRRGCRPSRRARALGDTITDALAESAAVGPAGRVARHRRRASVRGDSRRCRAGAAIGETPPGLGAPAAHRTALARARATPRPKPSRKATGPAPAPTRSRRTGALIMVFKRALQRYGTDARAGDALPEGGAGLGRAARLGPRPGEELAPDGVRLLWLCPSVLPAASSGNRRKAASRPMSSRSTSWARSRRSARRSSPTSRPTRRSPGISRASSPTCARSRSIRCSCAGTGSRPTTSRPTTARSSSTTSPAANDPFKAVGERTVSVAGDQRRARLGQLVPGQVDRADLTSTTASRKTERWTAILSIVTAAAAHRRRAAQESARPLRQRPQLVARAQPRRNAMTRFASVRCSFCPCPHWRSRPAPARTPPPAIALRRAPPSSRRSSSPSRRSRSRSSTVPEPLPLPGQLQPPPQRRKPDTRPPTARVDAANKAALQRADRRRLHQCRAGLSLHGGRALPALCRARAGQRHRPAAGRAPDRRSRPAIPCAGSSATPRAGPGQTKQVHVLVKPFAAGPQDQSRHHHRPAQLSPRSSKAPIRPPWRRSPGPIRRIGLSRSSSRTTRADGRCARSTSGCRWTICSFRYAITGDNPPWRPVRAFDDGTQGLYRVPGAHRPGRGAAALRRRARRRQRARQLPGPRQLLHRRPPVRRRRAAPRPGPAAGRPDQPHRCAVQAAIAPMAAATMSDHGHERHQPPAPSRRRSIPRLWCCARGRAGWRGSSAAW